MWCHLCKKIFTDQEIFSVHIMKKHRLSSKFKEDNSDSAHSKHSVTNDSEIDENDEIGDENDEIGDEDDEIGDENDEIGDENGEDSFFANNCSENDSHIDAVTPRRNARVKTKQYKFTSSNNIRDKTHSRLSISKSNQPISKSAYKHKKLNILKQISKPLTNYNFLSNQPVSQPVLSVSCLNELNQHPLPKVTGFDFDSQNILLWLQKFKEMCKKFKLPLEPRLFNKIKTLHKDIFDNYSSAQSNEVTSAVLRVYEELDWLINRHIISINDSL